MTGLHQSTQPDTQMPTEGITQGHLLWLVIGLGPWTLEQHATALNPQIAKTLDQDQWDIDPALLYQISV